MSRRRPPRRRRRRRPPRRRHRRPPPRRHRRPLPLRPLLPPLIRQDRGALTAAAAVVLRTTVSWVPRQLHVFVALFGRASTSLFCQLTTETKKTIRTICMLQNVLKNVIVLHHQPISS